MISEESCDTKDCNDVENVGITEIKYILEYLLTENCYFQFVIIFFSGYWSNKCSLDGYKIFSQNIFKKKKINIFFNPNKV